MQNLDAKAASADAMLRAGNLARAKDLCREVLEANEDHFDAFETLINVRLEQKDLKRARALCEWRLGRLANCVDTNLTYLTVQCFIGQKKDAKKTWAAFNDRFAHYPIRKQQAELLYTHHFGSKRKTRKLIDQARISGNFAPEWLDNLEQDNRNESGHIFRSYRLLKQALENNPDDEDALYSIGVISVLTGRLWPAIRHARRGKALDPSHAPAFNEIIFASIVSQIPLFWGAQLYVVLNATLTTRLFWLFRIPFNLAFLFMCFTLQIFILYPLNWISAGLAETMGGVALITNLIWFVYLMFGFQRIGMALSGRDNRVTLKSNY